MLPRSSSKMIQALPLVESGAAKAFGLTTEQLALACASHQGAPMHTDRVQAWLKDLGLGDDDLCCGPQAPRAFLLHHGHSKLGAEANTPGATWYDYYNMSTFLAETADADVFIVSMPLYGLNAVPGVPESHGWFRQFEADPGHSPGENGTATLRFFLEPVVLTTNYALSLGYEEVRRVCVRVCARACVRLSVCFFCFVYYVVGLGAFILQCRVRARAPADDNLPMPSLARRRCL